MNATIGILNLLESLIVVFVSYIDVVISICNRLMLFLCLQHGESSRMYSVMCVDGMDVYVCMNSRRGPTFKICN